MAALSKAKLGGIGLPSDFIATMTAKRDAEERRKRQQAAYLANMPQTGQEASTPAPTRVGKVQDWVQSGLEGIGVMPKRAAQLGTTAARLAELGGLGAFDEAQYGRPGEALEFAVGGPLLPARRLIKAGVKELAEHLPNVEKTASAVVDPIVSQPVETATVPARGLGNRAPRVPQWTEGNNAAFKGKAFWSGVFDPLDGHIVEVHPYERAEAADFHHSHYVSPKSQQKMKEGAGQFFWVEPDGTIQTQWREGAADPKIVENIRNQLELKPTVVDPVAPQGLGGKRKSRKP